MALMCNSLICLPTGIDHGNITALLMYNFGRYFPEKVCVFIAPTSEAAEQSRSFFHYHFGKASSAVTIHLQQSPSERGQLWSSQKMRHFFTVPQAFNNDLLNRNCSLSSISLIICESLDDLFKIMIFKDLIRNIKDSSACNRLVALLDMHGSSFRSLSKVADLFQSRNVICHSLYSESFSSVIQKVQLVSAPISEEHQNFIELFETLAVRPILEEIRAICPIVRFPPICKLSSQILCRIQETCQKSCSSSHSLNVDACFDKLREQILLMDDLQYNEYHSALQLSISSQAVHPKTAACISFATMHKGVGKVIIVSHCRRTCSEYRSLLDGHDIVYSGDAGTVSVGSDCRVLFTSVKAFFDNQRLSDQIVVNAHSVQVLVLDDSEKVNYEKSLQNRREEAKAVVDITNSSTFNSIVLPSVPKLIRMVYEEECVEAENEYRPERAFITELMLSNAAFPDYDVQSCNDISYRIGKGLKTVLFRQIISGNDEAVPSNSTLHLTAHSLESWISSHIALVDLDHFYVPDECYVCEPALEKTIGYPSSAHNIENHDSVKILKRFKSSIIESSDQVSSPDLKRPRKEPLVKSASVSRFVDLEAGVSGTDIDDDELLECSSMQDFIDDRSEVTVVSSFPAHDIHSQSADAPSSMMAFYRQSLLSSQPSAFSQPAGQYRRRLKVKIPIINENTVNTTNSESSHTSVSSTELLESALNDMDWSDDDLEV